jgi:SAM-dependent methyltransferase
MTDEPVQTTPPHAGHHAAEKRQGLRRYLPEQWLDVLDIGTSSVRWFLEEVSRTVPAGALVLDAGAGECQYDYLFAHTRYVAVDFAQGDAEWDYSRLDAIAQLTELPFPDHVFDAVVCTQVLEHVPEPKAVLKEIARVMRPGGNLLFTVPLTGEEHQQPYDFYRYTSFGLQYLFGEAGLDILEMRRLGGMFWFLAIVLPRINPMLFTRTAKILLFPVYLLSKLVLGLIVPLLFFRWDRYDRDKDLALNFGVIARKPGGPVAWRAAGEPHD